MHRRAAAVARELAFVLVLDAVAAAVAVALAAARTSRRRRNVRFVMPRRRHTWAFLSKSFRRYT
jgi:hypothetical protein